MDGSLSLESQESASTVSKSFPGYSGHSFQELDAKDERILLEDSKNANGSLDRTTQYMVEVKCAGATSLKMQQQVDILSLAPEGEHYGLLISFIFDF